MSFCFDHIISHRRIDFCQLRRQLKVQELLRLADVEVSLVGGNKYTVSFPVPTSGCSTPGI